MADMTSNATWNRLVRTLEEVGPSVYEDPRVETSLEKAESLRYLLRVLDGMVLTGVEFDDPEFPRLVRLFDSYRQYADINPDCIYQHARISAEHSYRIHGTRGSARIVDVQTMKGNFIDADQKGLVTLSNIEADEDGNLEVILSSEPHEGNWVELQPGVGFLYLRQYFYDWETEVPANLQIERIGAVYPPPLLTEEELSRRVNNLVDRLPSWFRALTDLRKKHYEAPVNTLKFMLIGLAMDQQYYGRGSYGFGPDEAIVIEFRPSQCTYWSFQLMNRWETLEYDVRQTSLNGHQAQLDPDGVFRAVISITDPGVPNWLDPGGRPGGLLAVRILRPEQPPEVSLRLVRLQDLHTALPADTPEVNPEARSESLKRRMTGVVRLFRQ